MTFLLRTVTAADTLICFAFRGSRIRVRCVASRTLAVLLYMALLFKIGS